MVKAIRVIAACLMLVGVASRLSAGDPMEGGWSAELLSRILKADGPGAGAASAPDSTREMELHTYRLKHLRVGEAGKPQNVIAILLKLLPPGSSMNPDVPTNSLHVLTTPVAHNAVWEYLSAVDVAEPGGEKSVPDEVRAALKKLADSGAESSQVLAAVASLQTDVAKEFANIDVRQRRQALRLLGGGIAFALLLIATLAWMIRRHAAANPDPSPGALALVPDQLATALNPVHDKMRGDMLGLLNEVAIKLQAQHTEQQKLVHEQQLQIEDARQALAAERRQFITEAGTMVVQAVERVDATTARLAKQQDKVSELVQELQSTVRELDATKDNLRSKEVELEQERAKIAALSLLLEDGASVALPGQPSGAGANGGAHAAADRFSPRFFPSCTNPDQAKAPVVNPPPNPDGLPDPTPRFTFLPPDHPEN